MKLSAISSSMVLKLPFYLLPFSFSVFVVFLVTESIAVQRSTITIAGLLLIIPLLGLIGFIAVLLAGILRNSRLFLDVVFEEDQPIVLLFIPFCAGLFLLVLESLFPVQTVPIALLTLAITLTAVPFCLVAFIAVLPVLNLMKHGQLVDSVRKSALQHLETAFRKDDYSLQRKQKFVSPCRLLFAIVAEDLPMTNPDPDGLLAIQSLIRDYGRIKDGSQRSWFFVDTALLPDRSAEQLKQLVDDKTWVETLFLDLWKTLVPLTHSAADDFLTRYFFSIPYLFVEIAIKTRDANLLRSMLDFYQEQLNAALITADVRTMRLLLASIGQATLLVQQSAPGILDSIHDLHARLIDSALDNRSDTLTCLAESLRRFNEICIGGDVLNNEKFVDAFVTLTEHAWQKYRRVDLTLLVPLVSEVYTLSHHLEQTGRTYLAAMMNKKILSCGFIADFPFEPHAPSTEHSEPPPTP